MQRSLKSSKPEFMKKIFVDEECDKPKVIYGNMRVKGTITSTTITEVHSKTSFTMVVDNFFSSLVRLFRAKHN